MMNIRCMVLSVALASSSIPLAAVAAEVSPPNSGELRFVQELVEIKKEGASSCVSIFLHGEYPNIGVYNHCSQPVAVTIRNAFGPVPYFGIRVEARSSEQLTLEHTERVGGETRAIRYQVRAKFPSG